MTQSLKDLVINCAILIATPDLIHFFILRRKPVNPASAKRLQVLYGSVYGILGIVLMLFTIHMDNTIVDLRQVALVLPVYFAGVLPGVVSALFIAAGRICIYGVNASSLSAAGTALAVTASIGAATFPDTTDSATQLYQRADEALY